jgi:hypothetical protein
MSQCRHGAWSGKRAEFPKINFGILVVLAIASLDDVQLDLTESPLFLFNLPSVFLIEKSLFS